MDTINLYILLLRYSLYHKEILNVNIERLMIDHDCFYFTIHNTKLKDVRLGINIKDKWQTLNNRKNYIMKIMS